MSVDRLIRSVVTTLETLTPPARADLCPRLALVVGAGTVPGLQLEIDGSGQPVIRVGERVLFRASGLVRVHAAFDPADGQPLRRSAAGRARLVAVAAGAGPVVATDVRILGVLAPTARRARLAFAMGWDEIDDVAPAPSGGVRLLSTALLGALTLDLVGLPK